MKRRFEDRRVFQFDSKSRHIREKVYSRNRTLRKFHGVRQPVL